MTVDRTHVLATPGMDVHGSHVALSRHRDGMDLHYGRDDFSTQDKLVSTLSRNRAKEMATDYDQQIDPTQDYAERRGITFRARVAQIMRKLVPENVRDRIEDIIDSLRSPGHDVPGRDAVQQSERESAGKEAEIDPEAALRRARGRAFVRHARAVDAIFRAQAQDIVATPGQIEELHEARAAFNDLRPHGSYDAEAVYKRNPELATEAASGDRDRALPARLALQLETEMRQNPSLRADRFVERFQELKQSGERQYAAGDYSGYRAACAEMGNMAMSLEHDPQLESLLEGRKRDLGISFESGMGISRDLAISHGLGRGRSLGIGM